MHSALLTSGTTLYREVLSLSQMSNDPYVSNTKFIFICKQKELFVVMISGLIINFKYFIIVDSIHPTTSKNEVVLLVTAQL